MLYCRQLAINPVSPSFPFVAATDATTPSVASTTRHRTVNEEAVSSPLRCLNHFLSHDWDRYADVEVLAFPHFRSFAISHSHISIFSHCIRRYCHPMTTTLRFPFSLCRDGGYNSCNAPLANLTTLPSHSGSYNHLGTILPRTPAETAATYRDMSCRQTR